MLDPELAEELRNRPGGFRVMRQQWLDLAFLHFAVEPEIIQATLPPGLSVDTFPDDSGKERAWVGLVPFRLKGLSLFGHIRIPFATNFLETNVRTYVHKDGRNPGVWFYSLDAQSPLACFGARATFGLAYWRSSMAFEAVGSKRSYGCRRQATGKPTSSVQVDVCESIGVAAPATLEFFLVERYVLYSLFLGKIVTARVHHHPYNLHRAKILSANDELIAAARIEPRPFTSILYSEGVDVDIFPLTHN